MEKKYKTEPDPKTGLLRVIALKDFANVKKGSLGGLIEKEDNLDQKGDCWVFGEAKVKGNATVSGNAQVCGYAWIDGNARICGCTCVGGENTKISGNIKLWSTTGISWVTSSIKDSKDCVIYAIKRDFYTIVLSDIYCVFEGNYLKNIKIIRQLYGKEV